MCHAHDEGTASTILAHRSALPVSSSSTKLKPGVPHCFLPPAIAPSSAPSTPSMRSLSTRSRSAKRSSASHQNIDQYLSLPIRICPLLLSKYHLLTGLFKRERQTRSRPVPLPCIPPGFGLSADARPRP